MTEPSETPENIDPTDAERLELLDRIETRIPELKLDEQMIEWVTLPDGAEALLLNGGGVDGGGGAFLAKAGDDPHVVAGAGASITNADDDLIVVGRLAPLAPVPGCIVITPDATRPLASVIPDPLAP